MSSVAGLEVRVKVVDICNPGISILLCITYCALEKEQIKKRRHIYL